MNLRGVTALAVADFRERVRRSAFAVTVLSAIALGYLSIPPASARYAMLSVGRYRGTYDSMYVGTVLAVMGGLLLSLAGFYVVKNAIARDTASGVGQILAATPMRSAEYIIGKFLSNLAVLTAMVLILAVMAPVMQLLRGESGTLDLFRLWLPFLLFPIPILAVAAAAAVVFETIPLLRGGFGNVVWFFAWVAIVSSVGSSRDARTGHYESGSGFDAIGVATVTNSMKADVRIQHPAGPTEVSAGVNVQDRPRQRFDWSGLHVTPELVTGRMVLLLLAVGLASLPALWFTRFDPSRRSGNTVVSGAQSDAEPVGVGPYAEPKGAAQLFSSQARPRAPLTRGSMAFRGLVVGELRVLVHGVSKWWFLVALGLIVAGAVTPIQIAVFPLLPVAWLWPIVIWSRLGTQQYEYNAHLLINSGPGQLRRLLAEWSAGLLLTAVTGLGPVLKMGMGADWSGVAAWVGGVLFIPTLALMLGSLSRSDRLFQAVYLMLWYLVVNGVAPVDFMGAVRTNGQLAGYGPLLMLGVTTVLFVLMTATQEIRHARR